MSERLKFARPAVGREAQARRQAAFRRTAMAAAGDHLTARPEEGSFPMSKPIPVTAPLASPATWESWALSKRTQFDGTRVPARAVHIIMCGRT